MGVDSFYTAQNAQYRIRDDSLETAMEDVMSFPTGFNKDNIAGIDKNSCARGVNFVLNALFAEYDDKSKEEDNENMLLLFLKIKKARARLNNFFEHLSAYLNCPKFEYNMETLVEDAMSVREKIKEYYTNNPIKLNDYMAGVKLVIGPIKRSFDDLTGKTLEKKGNKLLGMLKGAMVKFGMNLLNVEDMTKPLVERLSCEINERIASYTAE